MNEELNIIHVICPFMTITTLGRLALFYVTHSKHIYHIHQPANDPYDEDEDIQYDGPNGHSFGILVRFLDHGNSKT